MTPGEDQTHQLMAAMNAKLDVLISQHGQLSTNVSDHEARIRVLEAGQVETKGMVTGLTGDVADHETRQRAADRWRYALPITALGALLTGGATLYSATKGH